MKLITTVDSSHTGPQISKSVAQLEALRFQPKDSRSDIPLLHCRNTPRVCHGTAEYRNTCTPKNAADVQDLIPQSRKHGQEEH